MSAGIDPLQLFVYVAVGLCWVVFALIFWLRKRPPRTVKSKRDRMSFVGVALQGVGYFAIWLVHRPYFTPLAPMPRWAEALVAAITVAVAIVSLWLCYLAVRTLGKQWAYVAQIVEGHKLVTEGPYAHVRNPIYTGMFGMLVATGVAVTYWPLLIAAAIIFLAGSAIRIRCEEKLLREAFGEEFEAYAKRVPAQFPRLV